MKTPKVILCLIVAQALALATFSIAAFADTAQPPGISSPFGASSNNPPALGSPSSNSSSNPPSLGSPQQQQQQSNPTPPNCTAPQVLDAASNTCVTPEPQPPVCTAPQVLDSVSNTCVTPAPAKTTCPDGSQVDAGTQCPQSNSNNSQQPQQNQPIAQPGPALNDVKTTTKSGPDMAYLLILSPVIGSLIMRRKKKPTL